MSDNSTIEWTDATWNPISGCDRVSPGCLNCYAIPLAHRFQDKPKFQGLTVRREEKAPGRRLDWSGVVRCDEEALLQPLRWKKPRRIFVNSMSDTFHKDIPDLFLDQMFAVMAASLQHTFQVLTKRPERALEYFADRDRLYKIQASGEEIADQLGWCHAGEDDWKLPLPNVWIGTSVETQAAANERIPHLLKVPAIVRFLSCEPLLGPVTLWHDDEGVLDGVAVVKSGGVTETELGPEGYDDREPGIDWVIVGGESGPGSRPMHPDWPRSLRDQCVKAGVPFFFKQHGDWISDGDGCVADFHDQAHAWYIAALAGLPHPRVHVWPPEADGDDYISLRVGKKSAGRELDGREWNEMAEVAG